MYEYLPIEDAKAGDIVECVNPNLSSFTVGELYILTSGYMSENEGLYTFQDDKGSSSNGFGNSRQCKLVKTKPGETAQVGDTIMLVKQRGHDYSKISTIGITATVLGKDSQGKYLINTVSPLGWKPYDCVVLCKATRTPNEYGNPFKVGDRVRRIAEGNSDCEIGDKHIVTEIKGVAVYYKNTLSSHYKNWELVEESQPNLCAETALPATTTECSQHDDIADAISYITPIPEVWEELYEYLVHIKDTYREYPSIREAGSCISDYGIELQEESILEFISNHPTEVTIPKGLFTGDEEMDKCLEFLTLKLKLIPEEETMNKLNLVLLLEMMAAMSAKEVTDATNAKHIGILTESTGSYVGYVYANTLAELEDVVRTPANEGRTLHVFDYSTTLAQKPRKVVAVARTKE